MKTLTERRDFTNTQREEKITQMSSPAYMAVSFLVDKDSIEVGRNDIKIRKKCP